MNRNIAKPTALPRTAANTTVRPLPLSGSEGTFTDRTYGTRRGIGNNNCYAWALDVYSGSGGTKLQPGNMSGNTTDIPVATCDAVVAKAAKDLRRRGYAADPDKPCKAGYYKVMSFLAPGSDYHWYKQHQHVLVRGVPASETEASLAAKFGLRPEQVRMSGDNAMLINAGLWSHKQGLATAPLLQDACGKAIRDPRAACRTYTAELNYTQFCAAMCVRAVKKARRV